MSDLCENGSFVSSTEIKSDVADRLKETHGIRGLELHVKGDDLEKADEFTRLLRTLKKNGVKISHEFSIKLDFPRAISKQKTLAILESMPKPLNGLLKARIYLNSAKATPAEVKP